MFCAGLSLSPACIGRKYNSMERKIKLKWSSPRHSVQRLPRGLRRWPSGAGDLLFGFSGCGLRKDLHTDRRPRPRDKSERLGRGIREVDDCSLDVGAAIVDAHRHRLSSARVCHFNPGAQRQDAVRGGHLEHVVLFAARRESSVKPFAVPGRAAHLRGGLPRRSVTLRPLRRKARSRDKHSNNQRGETHHDSIIGERLVRYGIMPTPTYQDADLLLRVYDLRREARLRKARDLVLGKTVSFKNYPEFKKKFPEGSTAGRQIGMVFGYWDMVCALVARGVLNEELFNSANVEHLFVWFKYRDAIRGMREEYGFPEMMESLERIATRHPAASRMEQWMAPPKQPTKARDKGTAAAR